MGSLGPCRSTVTVFFLDLVNFTHLTSVTPTQVLVKAIAHIFDCLSSIIIDQAGTIDKFIGDCVMAFWNAPYIVPHRKKTLSIDPKQFVSVSRPWVSCRLRRFGLFGGHKRSGSWNWVCTDRQGWYGNGPGSRWFVWIPSSSELHRGRYDGEHCKSVRGFEQRTWRWMEKVGRQQQRH